MFLYMSGNASAVVDYTVDYKVPKYKKSIIIERLEGIEKSVDLRYNNEVKKYVYNITL